MIARLLKSLGICYTVEILTGMDNRYSHKCFSIDEALEWIACYHNDDKVMVTGFGGLYTVMARGI